MHTETKKAYHILFLFIAAVAFLGILLSPLETLFSGMYQILIASNLLITDYFVIAGVGPTLVNVAAVTFLTALLLYYNEIPMMGGGFLTIGLMSGFSFFGKNIFNMWFFLLGTALFCKLKKEKFSCHIMISLLSTALAPLISATLFGGPNGSITIKTAITSALCGLLIGFVMPMLAAHTERLLHGLTLYNGGFAIGLLALLLVPILKSYGFSFAPVNTWAAGYNLSIGTALYGICLLFIFIGYRKDGWYAFRNYRNLLRRPGSPKEDFIVLDGMGAVFINIGINGMLATTYILLIGGNINGPTVGGILTIMGFGAKGKHARNILPIMLGVYLGGLTKMWSPASPSAQLAALFGTTLAPVAGTYGFFPGILAGFIHSSVVLHAGLGYSGVNLYNNGFAGGIVSIVMYSVLSTFLKPNTYCKPSPGVQKPIDAFFVKKKK